MIDLERILRDNGVELYDSEIVTENDNKIYRVYITKNGGVSLEDCAEISRIISPLLDLEPPVGGAYSLEVSSPGIERVLKKPSHFKGSIGEKVRVKLINTDTIKGILEKFEDDSITLKEDDGEITKILLEDIDKAKTYFEW